MQSTQVTHGSKIKAAREEKKMSQEELSIKSGVSRTVISELENGQLRTVSSKALLVITKALGSTIDELFFEENGGVSCLS